MNHDLMRGIKGGWPFYLIEQMLSVTNWLPYNALKRSGGIGFLIWQAVAHVGDSVFFLQMRRSVGACKKHYEALMDHAGHEHTRVFREMQALGAQLTVLPDATLGARTVAKAVIVVGWDNWWALEYLTEPSCELKYPDEVERYYQLFFELNISVDIVSVEDDLEEYKIVMARDQTISGVTYVIQSVYSPRLLVFVEV